MDTNYKLRVVCSPTDIRKVSLQARPDSVESLIQNLKTKLNIKQDFTLHYADPDFGGEMINLTDVNELPDTFVSVRVVYKEDDRSLNDSLESEVSVSSNNSSHDTMSVSSVDDAQSLDAKLRQGSWPDNFELPKFGPELDLLLDKGNNEYLANKQQLIFGKDHKGQILDAIANHIWEYKAYPTHMEYTQVAQTIISKYPCLIEKGSSSGFDGLLNSLKFKMGNLRAKMRKLDCMELKINSRKRSCPGTSKPTTKKPKRAEVNYLPDIPKGEDETSMEFYRETLVADVQKKQKDMTKIHSLMTRTYAYRRQELVMTTPPVKQMLEKWPGLFLFSEIKAEFTRLCNLPLETTFYSSLDEHLDRMLQIFRLRQGASASKLQTELKAFGEKDITAKRTGVLRCIPVYFNEKAFYKEYEDTTTEEDIEEDAQRIVVIGEKHDPINICIVIDKKIILDNIETFPMAVLLYFATHYCLHLEYAKGQERTMELLQKVIFGLNGKKLSPKIQSFKNKLFA